MNRHIILKFLFSCLIIFVGGITAYAYDVEVNGIYYNFSEDSCVVVTYGKSNSNSYTDTVNVPSSVIYGESTYRVAGIGRQAFYNCSKLKRVTLPESLTEIGSWAFGRCSELTEIAIPDSVTVVGDFAFEGCSALKSVSINTPFVSSWFAGLTSLEKIVFGDNVDNIEIGAFNGCTGLVSVTINTPVLSSWFSELTGLQEIILGGRVMKVEENAIPADAIIYTLAGSKTLLAVWSAGYLSPREQVTGELLPPTSLTFVSSTQASALFKIVNIYPDFTISFNGKPLHSSQIQLENLKPGTEGELSIDVSLEDVVYQPSETYTTKGLHPYLKETVIASTSFGVIGTYEEGDAEIAAQRIEVNGKETVGNEAIVTGLDPLTTYKVKYVIVVNYLKDSVLQAEFADSLWIKTGQLVLNTLEPKVVSPGEVIVAARTNIENDVENVGFEWRRTDAPVNVESRSGIAYLFEGTMEGILHNLTSSNYWNFRPYYQASSGNKYFGDWGLVEADDYSYFEPTVHTYDNIAVSDDSAQVSGYAIRGTDNVDEQGFVYWEANDSVINDSTSQSRSMNRLAVPVNAKKIQATGQVMRASITSLSPNCTYHVVAYVTTDKGVSFYGEQKSFRTGNFTTDIDNTTIKEANSIEIARYNMKGYRISSPQRGLNIIRMSDGTVRKIMVK